MRARAHRRDPFVSFLWIRSLTESLPTETKDNKQDLLRPAKQSRSLKSKEWLGMRPLPKATYFNAHTPIQTPPFHCSQASNLQPQYSPFPLLRRPLNQRSPPLPFDLALFLFCRLVAFTRLAPATSSRCVQHKAITTAHLNSSFAANVDDTAAFGRGERVDWRRGGSLDPEVETRRGRETALKAVGPVDAALLG